MSGPSSPAPPAGAGAGATGACAPIESASGSSPSRAAEAQRLETGKATADGASPGVDAQTKAGAETDDDVEDGETASPAEEQAETLYLDGPPLPNEPIPDGARHSGESVPAAGDDGWECQWEPLAQAWYFYNRFTGVSQWENPRVPEAAAAAAAPGAEAADTATGAPQAPVNEKPPAGGYNPAIHGDYDPNAWYAQVYDQEEQQEAVAGAAAAFVDPSVAYGAAVGFNYPNGPPPAGAMGPNRHSDEAKARRQMNAFFDVDAAANAHDGRSLKAERQNQRLSKSELKAYKEKRRAKKEEKRRAWLMD